MENHLDGFGVFDLEVKILSRLLDLIVDICKYKFDVFVIQLKQGPCFLPKLFMILFRFVYEALSTLVFISFSQSLYGRSK